MHLNRTFKFLAQSLLVTYCAGLFVPLAKADSLSDLKTTLATLKGDSTIRAKVSVKLEKTAGEGKALEHQTGSATIHLEASAQGFNINYSPELLKQLALEQIALESTEYAPVKTANLAATEAINADNLRKMTDASEYLNNKLARATFKNEQADTVQNQPARLLTFDLRNGNLSKKEQAYVKTYEGILKVWLTENGIPLASTWEETYAGRAYLVVGFKVAQKENIAYTLAGKRLVATRYETLNKSAGGGELGSANIIRTLALVP